MSQKAILTFTDADDDRVNIALTFDPPMKGDAQVTAAVSMALQALQSVRDGNEEEEDD